MQYLDHNTFIYLYINIVLILILQFIISFVS